jgi:Zinc-finger associated domain (zf-AD)
MENVKSVTKNIEKFVNYTKQPKSEDSQKVSDEIINHQQSRKIQYRDELQDELIETEEVEYIDEDLVITRADEMSETNEIYSYCRLCAKTANDLIPIFDEIGELTEDTECLRLMPEGLITKDDNLPQYTCVDCLQKLQSCASIIDRFVSNQSLFVSE